MINLVKNKIRKAVREVLNENVVGYPMHFRTIYDDIGDGLLINEGLIKTYPLSYVQKYFDRRYVFDIREKYFNDNDWKVILVLPSKSDKAQEITDVLNRFGYYLGYKEENDRGLCLQFEPKFQNKFTGQQMKEVGCKYLIHVSPMYNQEKIMANGLCPTSRNGEFSYPNRIYLFLDTVSDRELESMVSRLSASNKSKGNDGRYCVFNVSLEGLEEHTFNLDFNMDNAVFTEENIPPTNLQLVKILNV